MGELVSSVEHGGASEDYVFLVYLVLLIDILSASEPHYVHHPGAVGEVCHDALLPHSRGKLLKTDYAPHYLHEGHVARQLAYAVHTAAVDVLVGEVLKQLPPRRDVQILCQNVPSSRTDTRQILYVLVENFAHGQTFNNDSAMIRSDGVVILMFSRLPSTIATPCPDASMTDASSVNDGE